MAEASLLPFVYVILAGIALGILLFLLRNSQKRPRLNISKIKFKAVTLSKRDLLQVNATIIAGLFILLSIQSLPDSGVLIFDDVISRGAQMEKYQEIMNDSTEDELVKEEAKKRYVEIKLDLEEDLIEFQHDQKTKILQFFFNPISYFFISMIFFVVSSISILSSRAENDSFFKLGEVLTIAGFIFIITSMWIMFATKF